ncbi:SURF1 family protein [Mesorhizobium sp. CAU 1741]|uniref:SURF1 family protein n=1 Tax=Mesorhizobium sp. CAU 1741 TaxID=3140366 RepID=UPI00325A5841
MSDHVQERRRGAPILLLVLGLVALAILLALGTWQVQRLAWKENLLATIEQRVASAPNSISSITTRRVTTGDVDYWPVSVGGEFRHEGERHFFATHQGRTGYFIYTPFEFDEGRYVLVNRGFVPFELKEPSLRPESQVDGWQTIEGLARNPLDEKPSWVVPENDVDGNIFYWKDLQVMAATSGVGEPEDYVSFFIDVNDAPNPGGLPVGGVTLISLPNSHLQYAVTWYGLALALVGVMGTWLWRQRKP